MLEAVLTLLLVFVVLNIAHKHYLIGTQAAIAVGAAITACGMIGGELTTASLNPARSIGPAIVSTKTAHLWVYVSGPAAGALVALAITVGLRPHRSADEFEAAQGVTAISHDGSTTAAVQRCIVIDTSKMGSPPT